MQISKDNLSHIFIEKKKRPILAHLNLRNIFFLTYPQQMYYQTLHTFDTAIQIFERTQPIKTMSSLTTSLAKLHITPGETTSIVSKILRSMRSKAH